MNNYTKREEGQEGPARPGGGSKVDGNPSCSNMQFWNISGQPQVQKGFASSADSPNQWFTTTNPDGTPIFTPPAAGTFVNAKVRNQIHGPGFQNWNLGLFKAFAINERTGFQFRAESFNFLNHPNWNQPNINPTSQTFGKVTSKTSERQLQLSLRFYF